MAIDVIVSAIAEWEAVKRLFPAAEIVRSPYGETFNLTLGEWSLTLFHSGWGKVASAGAMQYLIDRDSPDLLVNLGTCGGFEGGAGLGEIVLVERTLIYDIVELMGDYAAVDSYYASSLDLGWLVEPYPYPVRRGLIASADSDLRPEMIQRLKQYGAIAADWESAALAWVANKNSARLLILRAVSDLVNQHGGEAYDNLPLFHERTGKIMQTLFEQLPEWLNRVRF